MLVIHPAKPEWGPGKVLKVNGNKLEVLFRDVASREAMILRADIAGLVAAPVQTDQVLDQRLGPLGGKEHGLSKNRPKRPAEKAKLPKNWVPGNKVLSVPVGETGHFIASYRVHACPDAYSYKPTQSS
jgi:hypothetical protein